MILPDYFDGLSLLQSLQSLLFYIKVRFQLSIPDVFFNPLQFSLCLSFLNL